MVWSCLRQHPSEISVKNSLRSDLFWIFQSRFIVGLVWFGLVWDNNHQKILWKFHLDPTCFACFREYSELVWFGLVWFVLVWNTIHLKVLWNFHQVRVSTNRELWPNTEYIRFWISNKYKKICFLDNRPITEYEYYFLDSTIRYQIMNNEYWKLNDDHCHQFESLFLQLYEAILSESRTTQISSITVAP